MTHNIHYRAQQTNRNGGEYQSSAYNGNNQSGCNDLKPEAFPSGLSCDTDEACRIPLMRRNDVVAYAMVDAADYEQLSVHRWGVIRVHRTSYAIRYDYRDKKVTAVLMHRDVLGLKKGDRLQVDHIDFDGLNNRRANLRAVTQSENCLNNRPSSRNKSGHVGISSDPRGRWHARLWVNGGRVHHSVHKSMQEAIAARELAKTEHVGAPQAANPKESP